jgi:hypothetical protein
MAVLEIFAVGADRLSAELAVAGASHAFLGAIFRPQRGSEATLINSRFRCSFAAPLLSSRAPPMCRIIWCSLRQRQPDVAAIVLRDEAFRELVECAATAMPSRTGLLFGRVGSGGRGACRSAPQF